MPIEILRKELLPIQQPIIEDAPVRWGGIFSGALITISLSFLFLLIGGTLGFPSLMAINPLVPELIGTETASDTQVLTTWIYTFVSQILAFAIGGYSSSKMSQVKLSRTGSFYGLTHWALVITSFVLVALSMNAYVELLLVGNFPTSSRWLLFGIVGLGMVFSMIGGSLGKVESGFESRSIKTENRIKAAS